MNRTIRETMTPDPKTLDSHESVEHAARVMADNDIGDVIVCDGDAICGIVTDRDITVRAVAHAMDPATTELGQICSRDVTTISPDDDLDAAVQLMRDRALRRIPVVEGDKPIGIVSIGDLAIDLDRHSALADISVAPAND